MMAQCPVQPKCCPMHMLQMCAQGRGSTHHVHNGSPMKWANSTGREGETGGGMGMVEMLVGVGARWKKGMVRQR